MTQSPCFLEWQSQRNQSLIHRSMRRQKYWFRLINEAVGLAKLEKIFQVPRTHSLVACRVLRRINSHTERLGQRGEVRWRQKASEFIFQEVDAELFVDSRTNSTSVNDIERPLLIIISNLDVLRVSSCVISLYSYHSFSEYTVESFVYLLWNTHEVLGVELSWLFGRQGHNMSFIRVTICAAECLKSTHFYFSDRFVNFNFTII